MDGEAAAADHLPPPPPPLAAFRPQICPASIAQPAVHKDPKGQWGSEWFPYKGSEMLNCRKIAYLNLFLIYIP